MVTLILATRNDHKVREMAAILHSQASRRRFLLKAAKDFPGAPEAVENAPDYIGNALKKALGLARWLSEEGLPGSAGKTYVVGDDSGLEVDALNGAPGVHSARYAAEKGSVGNASDQDNREKLLRALQSVPSAERTARFRCVLAMVPLESSAQINASPVCYADELEFAAQTFEGVCEGKIVFEPVGNGGFGYDPIFVPRGFEQTLAELGDDTKNQISHRARALQKLAAAFDHVS